MMTMNVNLMNWSTFICNIVTTIAALSSFVAILRFYYEYLRNEAKKLEQDLDKKL